MCAFDLCVRAVLFGVGSFILYVCVGVCKFCFMCVFDLYVGEILFDVCACVCNLFGVCVIRLLCV